MPNGHPAYLWSMVMRGDAYLYGADGRTWIEPRYQHEEENMPAIYLSRAEVAARIGVKPDTLGRYKLPEPDAVIGRVRGWLPETIDAWHSARPRK